MPNIVQGNVEYKNQNRVDFQTIDNVPDYSYPNDLDLRPWSNDHKRIKDNILERARESSNVMTGRYKSWNKIDKIMTAYIRTSDKEKDIKTKDDRKPVSILFPYSYVMMETMLAYMVGAFFQDPIFRYEGYSPEDTIGAILLERVIQLHCIRFKIELNLHTMFRDAFSYGLGIVSPGWGVRTGYKTRRKLGTILQSDGTLFDEGDMKTRSEELTLFEGNKLDNIDPYMFLPDPNAGTDIQKGEYLGWVVLDNYMNLLREERQSDGKMFNVEYLQAVRGKYSTFVTNSSQREKKTNNNTRQGAWYGTTNRVDVIPMYVDIIPNDKKWRLGKSSQPEKWYFELANDSVLIKAEPANFDHNMYSAAMCAPEFDGYTPTPVSKLEMMQGLQETMDWLFNSHVANVRKAINDTLIVDPYMLNMNDLKDGKPGGIVRLRRAAWGRGVDNAVKQLQVNDITRANMGDNAYMTQWMERVAGADSSMSGNLRQGGPDRLTKAEFQGTRAGGIGRLERVAKLIGMQAMQDIGYMFASNCQQLMDQEVYIKAVGDYQQEIMKSFGGNTRGKVTPYDLLIDYDAIPKDGSIPGGNFSDSYIELFKVASADPEIRQDVDISRLFLYIAKQLGAKNVEDFRRNVGRIQPETVPDEQIQEGVEAGTIQQV